MIIPLYEGKGESTECKNYRGISLSSVVRILVDILCRVTEGLINQRGGCR